MTNVRTGQGPGKLPRAEFSRRFLEQFYDPMFEPEEEAIARLEAIAWDAYCQGSKAPLTREAGSDFEDPKHELSVEWLDTRARIRAASERQAAPATPSRVLLVCASARNDDTCPSEMSKTFRLTKIAEEVLTKEKGAEVDLLDLSLVSSEYGKKIHPCKGCASTAMPLCHWPCSCYPNHSLGQTGDAMADIYVRFTAAHAILIVTPVYWYQVPAALKAMIDRLVCADGGNADPTSTSGKDAKQAKKLELAGWDYPKHLDKRVFGLVVHGDVAGIEGVRRSLTDWLEWMGLVDAGATSKLDRYIGYYKPYATSHDALDDDHEMQEETRNVARAVGEGVALLRAGQLPLPDRGLARPRPK